MIRAVAVPATYTLAGLAALPQTTFTTTERWWRGSRTRTELEDLVNDAGPTPPAAKNALLRVTTALWS